jgi:hypothetical protein
MAGGFFAFIDIEAGAWDVIVLCWSLRLTGVFHPAMFLWIMPVFQHMKAYLGKPIPIDGMAIQQTISATKLSNNRPR